MGDGQDQEISHQIMTAGRHRVAKPVVTFLVDSREQLPLRFGPPVRKEFADGGSRVVTLHEGDYSVAIDGDEPLNIRLERKSLGDLYGCVCWGRDRFERELARLEAFAYRAIVIETTLGTIESGYQRSQIRPHAAIGSLCAWSVRHNIAVWLVDSHLRAAAIAQRLLENFALEVLEKTKRYCCFRGAGTVGTVQACFRKLLCVRAHIRISPNSLQTVPNCAAAGPKAPNPAQSSLEQCIEALGRPIVEPKIAKAPVHLMLYQRANRDFLNTSGGRHA